MAIDFNSIIQPELIVLIPVCWGIGILVKATSCPNNLIPFINCIVSILLATLYQFTNVDVNFGLNAFTSITQGILCFVIAWGSYEKLMKVKVEESVIAKLTCDEDEECELEGIKVKSHG